MERRHAIIVIKDNDGKYLQYFDKVWNSYLFINCKIEDENNYEYIKDNILKKYNIDITDIELKMDKIHSKYSQRDKFVKEYHHYFYVANIKNKNKKFKYFSYDELLKDERVMEVNSDVLNFIKEIDFIR